MNDMTQLEALEEARDALEERCSNTDTASPEGYRARMALEVIEAMIQAVG